MTPSPPNQMRRARSPRPEAVVREQIADLEACLNVALEVGLRDEASRFSQRERTAELSLLREELRAALLLSSQDDAELALKDEETEDNTIEISVLGNFLYRIQMIMNVVAQTIQGELSQTGRFVQDVVRTHQLRASATFPSSFGLRLRQSRGQETLGDVEIQGPLEILLLLLEPTDQSKQAAIEFCVGNPRLLSHYSRLLELLVDNHTSLGMATRAQPFRRVFKAADAAERRAWLESITKTEATETLIGELGGTSLFHDRFEMRVNGAEIRGLASKGACEAIKRWDLLGKRVRAIVRTTVVRHAQQLGEPKTRYFLESVELASSESKLTLWDLADGKEPPSR